MGYVSQCETSSDAESVVRVTEVMVGLDNLNSAIESLHKELNQLGERLMPVLSPKPDSNVKDGGCPPEPKRCDVAKIIYECTKKVDKLKTLTRTIIKDLEV